MPQLMPLPWIVSCFMIFFLFCMMSVLYGSVFLKADVSKFNKKYFLLWSW